jgi:restriction system protein
MSLVRVGPAKPKYTAAGRISSFHVELWHDGLKEHALLRATDPDVLQNKAQAKVDAWETKWERVSEAMRVQSQRKASKAQVEKGKNDADARTAEAAAALEAVRLILDATLDHNDAVNWTKLEDRRKFIYAGESEFPNVEFNEVGLPLGPRVLQHPQSPVAAVPIPPPVLGFLDRLFKSRRERKLNEHAEGLARQRDVHDRALKAWTSRCLDCDRENERRASEFAAAVAAYEGAKTSFLEKQAALNAKVRDLKEAYLRADPDAVSQNCELVLNASEYPDFVSKDFVLNYNGESRMLVVDYQLPPKSALPTLVKVAFVQSRGEFKEAHLSEPEQNRSFDDVLYKIALRTLHELFEADVANAIDSITFNGWVEDINPATGQNQCGCLLSVQAKKLEFMQIDLRRVDPKACFKQLRGVAASKLSGMTPVRPILMLERDDPRFVSGYGVSDQVDESTNLASMDWEDFEHLIRELFEKEFAAGGGEVRVTRASARRWRRRRRDLRSRSDSRRKDRHPSQALHRDGRRLGSSRLIRHADERRSQQGHPRDDSGLRARCVRLRQRQANHVAERRQPAPFAGEAWPSCSYRYQGSPGAAAGSRVIRRVSRRRTGPTLSTSCSRNRARIVLSCLEDDAERPQP